MKEYDTNLVGRLVEVHYPEDSTRPRGRVSSAYPSPWGAGLVLWLEIEDAACASQFPTRLRPEIGDVIMVHTDIGTGPGMIRILKDPPSDDALVKLSVALYCALEDVARARRLVSQVLHQRPETPNVS